MLEAFSLLDKELHNNNNKRRMPMQANTSTMMKRTTVMSMPEELQHLKQHQLCHSLACRLLNLLSRHNSIIVQSSQRLNRTCRSRLNWSLSVEPQMTLPNMNTMMRKMMAPFQNNKSRHQRIFLIQWKPLNQETIRGNKALARVHSLQHKNSNSL